MLIKTYFKHRKFNMIYKAVTLILAAVMLLSTIMTGTLAWQDFSQHKTNMASGSDMTRTVLLQKYEKDANGVVTAITVKDAEFYLYDDNDTQIGGRFVTDENGKINISSIEPGDYYFLETNPSYAYTYDRDGENKINKYPFTVKDTDVNVVVHAFNRRITADLIVTKEVKNVDGTALTGNQLAAEFAFTVTFSDGGAYPYTIDGVNKATLASGGTMKLKHGEKALFTGLPVGVLYTVTETPSADYIISGTGHNGNITKSGNTAEFINTFGVEINRGNAIIQITKEIKGNPPAADVNKEFEFTLKIDGVPQEFTLKAGETKTFPLDIGAVYDVTEKDYFADGYSQAIAQGYGTATTELIEVTATNTFVGTEMIEIPAQKTWDFTNLPAGMNQNDVLPKSITVHLKNGDKIVDTAVMKPDSNKLWKYTFTAPKYDADDGEIDYTIEEVPVDGFISTVDGFEIANIYVPLVTYKPSIEKRITGDTPNTPADFSFKLTAQNNAVPSAEIPMPDGSTDGKKTITLSGGGIKDFGDIQFTKAGIYTYTVTEIKGNADGYSYDKSVYTLTVTVEQKNNKLVLKSAVFTKTGDSKEYDKAAFTNTYTKPETVAVKVTKEWIGSNPDQPQSVQVQLYKNGTAYGSLVTLNHANSWTHTWNGLDPDAAWTVDEPTVPERYTKKITGDAAAGFTLTNTFDGEIPPPATETVTISGSKTWNHGKNVETARPKSIIIYLKDQYGVVLQKEISEANHWSWAFVVDKYDPDGNEYIYTVDEAPVPGYTKHINGYNITNSHDTYEEITISGYKTWEHGGNTSKHPDSITVYVKNGDKIVAEKAVTAANEWKYTFNLPRHDETGKDIHYTISEANVPYYTMTRDGYNMKNTFKGFDYPGDVPKTGDSSNLWLWVCLMIASMMLLIITLVMGKKNKGRHYKRIG